MSIEFGFMDRKRKKKQHKEQEYNENIKSLDSLDSNTRERERRIIKFKNGKKCINFGWWI